MMNIKILDPIPENEVMVTIPFGSHVYGTNNVKSDRDFLKILKQDTGSLLLQYVHNPPYSLVPNDGRGQVDYVYTGSKTFWDQAKSGANVVFFEAMHTIEFKNWMEESQVEPFNPMDYAVYNSRVAKAYLGLAKRDLHYPERQHHVMRCIWMAEKIIAGELINLKDVAGLPQTLTDTKEATLDKITNLRKGLKY